MITTQTNIALQIVATLTEEEKAIFAVEFQKMYVVKTVPKKKKKVFDYPSPEVLAEQYLAKHRAKYASQTQV